MRRTASLPPARGFTLIELVVTFALVAVMLVLAAPSFVKYQRNSELTSVANDFIAAVSAARSEAMKTQKPTFVVPASGTDWTSGWIVYVDNDWSNDQNSGDTTISRREAIPSTVTVSVSAAAPAFADGSSRYISFNGSGFMRLTGGSFPPTGAIDFTNTSDTRRVIVSPAGRLRVCNPTDAGCTISSL